MSKLISITNDATETFDEQLFSEFMEMVPVWDYANISRENYLSLSHDDKEKIIRQYYSDMKARSNGKFGPTYCLLCLWDKLG